MCRFFSCVIEIYNVYKIDQYLQKVKMMHPDSDFFSAGVHIKSNPSRLKLVAPVIKG